VLTACELDFQTRGDARVLTFARLPQASDADDLTAVARAGHPAPADRDPAASGTALISYTSGTSGAPKGATNTHANLMYNAERQSTGLHLPEGPVYYALAPLFHITGMVCQLGACLNSAGTLVLTYRFEAGLVLEAFAEHRPHYTVGPSTAFMALAAHPDVTRDHFSSFVNISSGGASLPPALVEKFRAGFGPYIRNGYGLTECSAPCASVPPHREAPVDPASGTLAVGDVPYTHPAVREAVPVGVPDGYRGETVKAYISVSDWPSDPWFSSGSRTGKYRTYTNRLRALVPMDEAVGPRGTSLRTLASQAHRS
jgi:long-chain acyl-CoA synthetase